MSGLTVDYQSEITKSACPKYKTPSDPAEAISNANLRGIASVRRLAVNRVTNQTRHIFHSIDKQWKIAKQNWYESRREKAYDFTIITRAEANIRKMYLRMIFENTQKYGNEVSIRIYDGLGDHDRLNGLFNMAGSMMRDFSAIYYPFPTPEKKDNQFGYTHRKYGFIPINHVNNPSLDFIDIIRSHVNELCRQMFIHKISINNSRKYIMQFLHRSAPFLDWIYLGGKRGKKWQGDIRSFTQVDKILREVINIIEKDVSYKSHRVRVTHQRKYDGATQLTRLKKGKKDINLYHRQFLTNQFYEELNINISRLKRRVGSLYHTKMAAGFAQPYNLRDVVFFGDRYSQKIKIVEEQLSDYIIVAELPLRENKLSGKADYVIFKKEGIKGNYFWKPVAILDLKTKLSIDWDIGSRTNKKNQQVPYPKIRRRKMKQDEWDSEIKIALNDARAQLDDYARILIKNYKSITGQSSHKLIRGVIVLDPSQKVKSDRSNLLQKMLYSFIYTLDNEMENFDELLRDGPHVFEFYDEKPDDEEDIDDEENPLKLAIIIDKHNYSFSFERLISLLSDKEKVSIPEYSPLGNPSKHVTLYLTGASRVNFGNIAAWIAAHYHLMSELQSKHEEIIILDLLSMLDNFTELRLRIDKYIDLDRFTILQYDHSMEFLDEINRQPVIITGWIEFKEMYGRHAYIIKNRIINRINSDEIYIISRPNRDVLTSSKYKMRAYLPFSYNQMENVSEIVWNLPVAPLQSKAPKYDNIRVIIKQKEDSIDLVEIKPLKHLSRGFNQNRKKKSRSTSVPLSYFDEKEKPKEKKKWKKWKLKEEKKRKEKEQIKNDAYELIPWFKDKKDAIPIEYLDYYQLSIKEDKCIHATSFNQKSKIRVDAKLRTRKSYSMRAPSTKHSYLPPNISDLVKSSVIRNFNQYVSYYLGKKMIGSVNLHDHLYNINGFHRQTNFDGREYFKRNLKSYERNFPVSGVLEQVKSQFYRNHVDRRLLDFEEFKAEGYWLDMILIMIHELNPKIKDDDLIRLWQYYSPWLLYSLGYINNGNSIFNMYYIWKQINRKVRKIDTEYTITPILHGTMWVYEQYSIINFGSRFHGIVSNLEDPFGKQWVVRDKHQVDKIKKNRSNSSIPLVITQIGEFEYLWKLQDDWILLGRINYRLGSQIEYLRLYPSIIDANLNIEHEKPMPQIVKKIIQTTCKLEFDGEERIKLIVSSEDDTFYGSEYFYSDLNSLIHDLRAGTRSELELEVDGKKHMVGWDKYKGINWGDLGRLKDVVNQYKNKIQNKFMEDLPETIEYLYIETFKVGEEDTLELTVYHIDDICPLRDIAYEEASKYPDHDALFHGNCWGLRSHEFELDDLLDMVGLYGVKSAFSGFDLLNLYNQEYIIWGEIKYNLKFDFDMDDDSSIYQENMGTVILFGKVYNKFMTKMLPLTHKLDDLYRIAEVELGKHVMLVILRSIRTDDVEFPKYYVSGDLICDQYREFDENIDDILSSNEVKGHFLTETDWKYQFRDIKKRISDHQNNCGCASTICSVFRGLDQKKTGDNSYEIEFKVYMVASNNVEVYTTKELNSYDLFHLGFSFLEENVRLIKEFGSEYGEMDRDLYNFIRFKFLDDDDLCDHDELMIDCKSEIEGVVDYAKQVFDHESISDEDRFKFKDLADFIEFVYEE